MSVYERVYLQLCLCVFLSSQDYLKGVYLCVCVSLKGLLIKSH